MPNLAFIQRIFRTKNTLIPSYPIRPAKCLIILLFVTVLGGSAVAQEKLSDTFALHSFRPDPPKQQSAWKTYRIPAFLFVYGYVAFHSDPLLDFDQDLQRAIWVDHPHKLLPIDNYLEFAPGAAVYALNLIGIKGAHNFVDRSGIYLISNIILASSVTAVKSWTKRERPNMAGDYSFPSGHTAEAFASAEFMRMEYRNVSPWYGVAGYAMALTTGYLRMYNNKHYFSDVVAGAGVGIASTHLAYWLYPKIKKIFMPHQKEDNVLLPFYQDKVVGVHWVYHL